MSTVSPGLSREPTTTHEAHGQSYVAAPVLGNPDLPRARKLFVLAAGRPSGLDKARHLLERLRQSMFVIGEAASAANLIRLAGNVPQPFDKQTKGKTLRGRSQPVRRRSPLAISRRSVRRSPSPGRLGVCEATIL
jgi:hypothetical protein